MKMPFTKTTCGLLQLAMLAAALSAQATIVTTVKTAPNGTFAVSTADLIETGAASFSSISIDDPAKALYGSTEAALNDGLIYSANGPGYTDYTLTPADGAVVTIALDTTSYPQGYDLKSIVSLTGPAQNRGLQSYDVAVATVSSGG
ncbi:MAG: hypothetical protein NT154_19090, partial [Verrucomicrobia bacterium]|nr:hypothetical protein [Verrucomicrobiota bacterium]